MESVWGVLGGQGERLGGPTVSKGASGCQGVRHGGPRWSRGRFKVSHRFKGKIRWVLQWFFGSTGDLISMGPWLSRGTSEGSRGAVGLVWWVMRWFIKVNSRTIKHWHTSVERKMKQKCNENGMCPFTFLILTNKKLVNWTFEMNIEGWLGDFWVKEKFCLTFLDNKDMGSWAYDSIFIIW